MRATPSPVAKINRKNVEAASEFMKRLAHPNRLMIARALVESERSALVPDRPLVVGSAMFGIGWGLAGFCPGPAVASLMLGLFVVAMLAGMVLHDTAVANFGRGRSP